MGQCASTLDDDMRREEEQPQRRALKRNASKKTFGMRKLKVEIFPGSKVKAGKVRRVPTPYDAEEFTSNSVSNRSSFSSASSLSSSGDPDHFWVLDDEEKQIVRLADLKIQSRLREEDC